MYKIRYRLFFAIFYLFFAGCKESPSSVTSIYRFMTPDYNKIELQKTGDTLHFLLNDSSYNDIESMNIFKDQGIEYISFFDQRSSALLIYSLGSSKIVNRIPLTLFFKPNKLYKTSVYVKNYDSILITNNTTLYLFDSSGRKKASTPFIEDPPTRALLGNDCPPITIGSKLYVGTRRSIFSRAGEYRTQKPLYEFDLRKDSARLYYNLPEIYYTHLYGYQYLYNSFCSPGQNRFVFSFAADTNIYEIDLSGNHIRYYAKSRYQDEIIKWKNKPADEEEGFKNYLTGQAYGSIYFDSYNRRYLRVAKRKISEGAYNSMDRSREQTVIVFDEKLSIIGESSIGKGIDLSSLIFTQNGKIYARVNGQDEYGLHFIRLQYGKENIKDQLTQNNK